MATSLVISRPHIPLLAPYILASSAANPYRPEYNLIAGDRATMFEKLAAGTSWSLTMGLGSTTKAADHMIIARADLLQTQGVTTVTLARSSDDSAYTNEVNNTSFASSTLYGPDGNDYVTEFTLSSAYKYWKFTASGASCNFIFSKLYVGQWFDMECEPAYSIDRVPGKESRFVSSSGAVFTARNDQPRYQVRLKWEGVTDAKTSSFFTDIHRTREWWPVFLYTRSVHAVLDNQRLLHCKLLDATHTYVEPNWNNIEAVFEEVVG